MTQLKKSGKFAATIGVDKKNKYLGCSFDSEEAAARAYDSAAVRARDAASARDTVRALDGCVTFSLALAHPRQIEFHGSRARLNFPEEHAAARATMMAPTIHELACVAGAAGAAGAATPIDATAAITAAVAAAGASAVPTAAPTAAIMVPTATAVIAAAVAADDAAAAATLAASRSDTVATKRAAPEDDGSTMIPSKQPAI